MTDRIAKIVIRGDISDLQAKMVAAGKSISAATNKMTDASKESAKWREGLRGVGDAAGKMGLVAAAGVGAAVAAAANFDQSMSNIKAATHESADNMEALRAAALKAGADTAFSATEAAGAVENLAKAGVSTADILNGGLDGALSLAAAGTLDVADAAEIAARAMSQFGLNGDQVPHVADLLAAAAGKAVGEVSDFGMALNQAGLIAAQTGLSIEETTGALASFAQSGLQGSDAGTSFKTMLMRLVPQTKEAGDAMESIGFNAFDAQGKFVGLTKLAGQLRKGLKDMGAEQRLATLQTLFGQDAIRAANVLYEQGAQGIQKWIDKVDDQGYAAETAAIKMDNLKGDLEQLKGSLETALIGGGEGSQSILRFIVQDATAAVNALNALPGPLKNVAMGLGALTAITGGGLFLGSRFVSAIADGRKAMADLGVTTDGTKTKLTDFGKRGLSVVADQARSAGQAFEEMSGKQVALRGGAAVVGTLALALNDLDDSSDRATHAMGELANVASGALLGFAAGGPVGAAIGGGVSAVMALVGALRDGDKASRDAAGGAKEYGDSLDYAAGAASDLNREIVANRLEQEGILSAAQRLGLNTEDLISGILGDPAAIQRTTTALRDLRAAIPTQDAMTPQADTFDLYSQGTVKVEGLTEAESVLASRRLKSINEVAGAFHAESSAIDMSAAADDRKAAAVGGTTDALEDNTEAIGDNIQAMKDRVDAAIGALDGEYEYQRALREGADREKERAELQQRVNEAINQGVKERADLQRQLGDAKTDEDRRRIQEQITESWDRQRKTVADLKGDLKDYRATLDKTTEAGYQNWQILKGQAEGWNNLSDGQKNAKGAYRQAREDLIDQAMKFGATRKEAEHYAKKLLEIPPRVLTKIQLEKERAQKALDAFKAAFDGLDGKTAKAFVELQQKHIDTRLGRGFSGGGYTGDYGISEVAGVVHGKEFVVNARATAQNRALLEAINRSVPGYKDGGFVRQISSPTANYYGGTEIDYDRLAAAVSRGRPLYGDVTVMGDGSFRRELMADKRRASGGGVNF